MQGIARDLHAAGLHALHLLLGRQVEDDPSIAFSRNLYKMLKAMLPSVWGSVMEHSWLATEEEQESSALEGRLRMSVVK